MREGDDKQRRHRPSSAWMIWSRWTVELHPECDDAADEVGVRSQSAVAFHTLPLFKPRTPAYIGIGQIKQRHVSLLLADYPLKSEVQRRSREGAINFRQLVYFRKVVEAGNITAAANMLNLAQPALGSQIRQLEKELGVDLIFRHSRGVSVTPAGEVLYKHAKHILDSVDLAVQDVRASSGRPQKQIRLGIGQSMMQAIGPDLVLDAKRTLPDFIFSIHEERSSVLLHALEQGQIDIAFVYNAKEQAKIQCAEVMEEDLLFVTAPSKASSEATVTFAEALRSDLIIGGERGVLRQIVEAQAQRLSLEMRIAFEVHSVPSMKAIVSRGTASTIIPFSLATKELREGTLVGRKITKPTLTRTLCVVKQKPHASYLDDERVGAHVESLVNAFFSSIAPWARRLPNL